MREPRHAFHGEEHAEKDREVLHPFVHRKPLTR
jgi:hypothetical protein